VSRTSRTIVHSRSACPTTVFFSNSPELLCRLAARGRGIAFVPEVAAARQVERGELVTVLPKTLRVDGRIALVYPERDLVPPQVRAFIDFMAERLRVLFPRTADVREAERRREAARPPRLP
jgi:DNA-binding transcriptional LysR family regulator